MHKGIVFTVMAFIVSPLMLTACFVSEKKPWAQVEKVSVADSVNLDSLREFSSEDGSVVFVSADVNMAHPAFAALPEGSPLGAYAEILMNTTYLMVMANGKPAFVSSVSSGQDVIEIVFMDVAKSAVFEKDGQRALYNVRFIFVVPVGYKDNDMYLKIFNTGVLKCSNWEKGVDNISCQEPNDVWFEYKLPVQAQNP